MKLNTPFPNEIIKVHKNAKNLSGQIFNRLKAIRPILRKRRHIFWECLCNCGKYTIVSVDSLIAGTTKSCGCFQSESAAKSGREYWTTHGLSKHRFYATWSSFHKRCYNKKDIGYCNYGGRGIYVCEEWNSEKNGINGFVNFLEWVKNNPKPEGKYSLDRINNDGPYSPENCRWASKSEQCQNKRKIANLEKYRQFVISLNKEVEFEKFCLDNYE